MTLPKAGVLVLGVLFSLVFQMLDLHGYQGQDVVRMQGQRQLLDADVQQLLAHESRDAALGRIVARGEYRGPGDYTEKDRALKVGHVVMCPQQRGLPIFAVFCLGAASRSPNRAAGHVILVASDGVMLRCWGNNNVVSHQFEDINEDGVVDRVDVTRYVMGEAEDLLVWELSVTPVDERGIPSLRVALDVGNRADAPPMRFAWRVIARDERGPPRLQLGSRGVKAGEVSKVWAEWKWDREKKAWLGPVGGLQEAFLRLPPDGFSEISEFATAWSKR